MACELIPDGYTQSDKCYGLNVTYRPMAFGDYATQLIAVSMASEEDREALVNKELCGRIISWDATVNGEPAPITPESLSRLPVNTGARLRNLINGDTTPDGETLEDNAKNSEAA